MVVTFVGKDVLFMSSTLTIVTILPGSSTASLRPSSERSAREKPRETTGVRSGRGDWPFHDQTSPVLRVPTTPPSGRRKNDAGLGGISIVSTRECPIRS